MYTEVIPQIRTIPKLGIFDYEIPKDLKLQVGDIVEISFRNQVKIGLVYKIKSNTKFKNIKPVTAKLDILISKKQINLITWLAKQYKISLALAFKIIFPEIPQKSREFKTQKINSQNITISKNRIKNITEITNKLAKNNQTQILHYNNSKEKNAVLMGLIKQQEKQTLIIVPEKKHVLDMAGIFHKFKPELICSGLSKNQEWQIWNNIKNNKTKLIIGTKNAIFIPPDNLDLIIIDDEEDKSHHNFDQNPKYHVLDVALQLKTKLFLTSQSPNITSYYKFNHLDLLTTRKNKVHLIDLEKEKQDGNYSYFSNKLVELIESHKKSLLIFNRKGEAKLLICLDCHEILPYSKTEQCSSCQGYNLKKAALGIKNIKKDLAELFSKKKIIEISKDNPDISVDADIIIGTEYALRVLDLDKFDFIGLVSVDHQLAIPDYQSSERVYQLITKIINLNKTSAIQTHSPDNVVIRSAIDQSYKKFYDYETKLRKQFKYPPYGNSGSPQ